MKYYDLLRLMSDVLRYLAIYFANVRDFDDWSKGGQDIHNIPSTILLKEAFFKLWII